MSTMALTGAPAATRPSIFQALREKMAQRALYNRTVAELNSLGDRELRDLGISRGEIRAIARRGCGLD